MSDIEIKNIVANFLSAKKNLKQLAPDFNWGNLLGDYGELVAIKHYGWEQAPTCKKGYDAINKQKKRKQYKLKQYILLIKLSSKKARKLTIC